MTRRVSGLSLGPQPLMRNTIHRNLLEQGMGTDEATLVRVLVSRCAPRSRGVAARAPCRL